MLTAGRMHRLPPHEVADILRSATPGGSDAKLTTILVCFRHRWLAWAQRRYPRHASIHEDAVQDARMLVLERIEQLRDSALVERWANSVFAHVLYDLLGKERRRARWHRDVPKDTDPDLALVRIPDTR